MRRGMAGAGSSDRAPIAVTPRGEADVEAATRAQGSRDRSNLPRRRQSDHRSVDPLQLHIASLEERHVGTTAHEVASGSGYEYLAGQVAHATARRALENASMDPSPCRSTTVPS